MNRPVWTMLAAWSALVGGCAGGTDVRDPQAPGQALTALPSDPAPATEDEAPPDEAPATACGTADILVVGQSASQVGMVWQTSTTPGWARLEAMPLTLQGEAGQVVLDAGAELMDAAGEALDPATVRLPAQVLLRATGTSPTAVRIDLPPRADGSLCEGAALTVHPHAPRGLTGRALAVSPGFAPLGLIDALHETAVFVDVALHPHLQGRTVDVVAVASRTQDDWLADPQLVPLATTSLTLTGAGVAADTALLDLTDLQGDALGVPVDVIVDVDRDGSLSPGDLLDGQGLTPSAVWLGDLGQPGPYTPTMQRLTPAGSLNDKDVFWPTELQTASDPAPLVVISHGNGHNYQWYAHVGVHLASWGFVVMSHQNNTMPGVVAASQTTIDHLDDLLLNQDTYFDGVLDGKIDSSQIGLIGHSRGGEGVVLAYDRVLTGAATAEAWQPSDIKVIQSIAPTVFEDGAATPHDVPFHLLQGAADGDVSGAPSCALCQPFRIAGYAEGRVMTTYVHGASHNVFHTHVGFDDGTGPDQLDKAQAHSVQLPTTLAVMAWHLTDRPWLGALFARHNGAFPIPGVPEDLTVASTFRDHAQAGLVVTEDAQAHPATDTSSSGGAVTSTLASLTEGLMDDRDLTLAYDSADAFNGLTWVDKADHTEAVLALSYVADSSWSVALPPEQTDLSGYAALQITVGQMTRAPETVAHNGALAFSVAVVDAAGVTGTVSTEGFAPITAPYPRTGAGEGTGWTTEMNTVRIPLDAFRATAAGGEDLDLSQLHSVELLWGPSHGSAQGRVFVDDLLFQAL